ncbi:uncharacterized protein LOC143375100 isoform X2 [Andrena cerasifolii]|uniref:uncharacterized protein LOC143375100 isoform X2 n=1 Tax=Andrena cerasifolii TaxID=2819439 RepID=UPI004038443A
MIMEDPELIQLQDLKAELLEKAHALIAKLKKQEADDQSLITLKVPNNINNANNSETKLFGQYEQKLCEVSRQVSGITFDNVDRKLLRDNLYQYTTKLVTKSLTCLVELRVQLKGEVEFKIDDITCHFTELDRCYMLEISPWVQNFTRMKNFSFLTSAISQYNEQNILRMKTVCSLEDKKYVTSKQSTEKNGGILVHVHSPENEEQQVYLEFQWSLQFIERTWQIEHFFVIEPTNAGMEFAKENQDLLQNFCQKSIKKPELLDLWQKLCSVIDTYESKSKSQMDCDTD